MPDAAGDSTGINLKSFESVDDSAKVQSYIDILDTFDALPGIQVLKQAAIERCRIRAGMSILDGGCGAGLETVRLARLVGPSGRAVGLDASKGFLAEATRRTEGLNLPVEYMQGDAHRLPFPDGHFDIARAERLFLYLEDPRKALAELVRVTKGGGVVYVIEPDFETTTVNVSDRSLVRKILNFDCDNDTRNGWIGRELPGLFEASGLVNVDLATSVVIYEPHAFSPYFIEIARSAFQNGVITEGEFQEWQDELHRLLSRSELFCTITYFAVIGQVEA